MLGLKLVNTSHQTVLCELASVWDVGKAVCTKVIALVVIHALHERLLDGRWGLDRASTYYFFLRCWLPSNSVWVNVSTLFCSSACLRAHRSRQAPRLIPSLLDTNCLNTPSLHTTCQHSHQKNYNNPFMMWFVLNSCKVIFCELFDH